MQPAPLGAPREVWVEKWYFQTEGGSNLEPGASDEEALSTLPTPHGKFNFLHMTLFPSRKKGSLNYFPGCGDRKEEPLPLYIFGKTDTTKL